jgi:phosphatidate cytidylyltransferase
MPHHLILDEGVVPNRRLRQADGVRKRRRREARAPIELVSVLNRARRLLGRHKVTPNVSPKKTWEGLIGGIATTTLVAALVGPYLTPMDFRWSALAGLILGIAGFLGDITMSAMKRDLGVKDTGGLIPGHGGILDRVDSLTYAAPAFVHFVRCFFYP